MMSAVALMTSGETVASVPGVFQPGVLSPQSTCRLTAMAVVLLGHFNFAFVGAVLLSSFV